MPRIARTPRRSINGFAVRLTEASITALTPVSAATHPSLNKFIVQCVVDMMECGNSGLVPPVGCLKIRFGQPDLQPYLKKFLGGPILDFLPQKGYQSVWLPFTQEDRRRIEVLTGRLMWTYGHFALEGLRTWALLASTSERLDPLPRLLVLMAALHKYEQKDCEADAQTLNKRLGFGIQAKSISDSPATRSIVAKGEKLPR